jgi:[ribosomal protein S5]-alanine N-acetyltransferase
LKKVVNKSNNLIIRPFKLFDVYKSNYFKWLADEEVTKYILRNELGKNFNKEIIITYLKKILSSKQDIFFSVFFKKKMIGTLKISKINKNKKSAEIGIMIGEKKYWNRGFGKILIKYLIVYCFEKMSLKKIYCGTLKKNIGMKKVFIDLGFKIVDNLKIKFENKNYASFKFELKRVDFIL